MTVSQIFEHMPSRYRTGSAAGSTTYYFSVGNDRFTVKVTPEACVVARGKPEQQADVVLKATPELFEKMVLKGKMPGPMDVALGRVKTNDPLALKRLMTMFDLSGI